MSMTVAAALALATACVGPSLAPIVVGIARHESGLDPTAINRNRNGTLDVGIAQINTSNFHWLGLNMKTAMDPCKSMQASMRVLLAKYNGNPPDDVKASYSASVSRLIPQAEAKPDLGYLDNLPLGE